MRVEPWWEDKGPTISSSLALPVHPLPLTGSQFSPCRSPHSLLPCPSVERGPGDRIGFLALSTPHWWGTITELTMVQVTQGPSVIIPKTDGRLRRNSLPIQGTCDCVAALRKPISKYKIVGQRWADRKKRGKLRSRDSPVRSQPPPPLSISCPLP